MLKKLFISLVSLFLVLSLTDKVFGQWSLFEEERAKKFTQPKDSTDIYKTIEEDFGAEKKRMVQEYLTERIYSSEFEKYLEGKSASEIVSLVDTIDQKIKTFQKIQNSYEVSLQHKKVENILGKQTKYFIEFKSLFEKQISEIDIEIWFYAYKNSAEGVIRLSKKNFNVDTNEEIQIPISRDKILEENGGRKKFKYRININRIGFSDFTYFDFREYKRAVTFMKPSELRKLFEINISSEI